MTLRGIPFELSAAALPMIAALVVGAPLLAQQTPAAVADADGFAIRSADGDFLLRLGGGLQYDARFFFDDDPDAPIDQFLVRRIRSDVQGTFFRDYDFRVHLDYAGGRVEVMDVYGNFRASPAVQLRAGKMKAPVGLERLQLYSVGPFPERGFPSALAPNRDIGIQLHGVLANGTVEYALGAFNGVPDGASADEDESDSKDLAGRLFVRPFLGGDSPLRGLGFGVGGSIGDRNGTPAAPALAGYRTVGRDQFFRYRADGHPAGTAVAVGRRTRISPQTNWYFRSFGLLGEYIRVDQTVRVADEYRDLMNEAWQIAGSWAITGEEASYRGIAPRTNFDLDAGTWGGFEVALRANVLRIDPRTFARYANPFQSAQSAYAYAAGVNWYLNRVVRVLASYEHTAFAGAPGGYLRPAENHLLTRVQVAF